LAPNVRAFVAAVLITCCCGWEATSGAIQAVGGDPFPGDALGGPFGAPADGSQFFVPGQTGGNFRPLQSPPITSVVPVGSPTGMSPDAPASAGGTALRFPPISPPGDPPTSEGPGIGNPMSGQGPVVKPPAPSASSQGGDASPLTVAEVRIVGNRRLPPEKILGQIRTRGGRPFDPRLIEEDVRRLNQTRWFASVRVFWQPVPEGRVVIFEVVERPLIQYVKIVGNEWYPKKRLLEEAGIRPGDGMDPFLIEEARRKIEDFYRERGFPKVRVSLVEGSDPNDAGVIFLISEGPRQRVLWTDFIGNSISSDARLRTKVQTKPGWFWLIRGYYKPEELERDRLRVLEYYRSLGFFRAEVGSPIVEFNEDRTWARVRFVVNEGPRYRIREVRILGNRVLETQDLLSALELKPGSYFSQSQMEADIKTLQEKYGSIGYVFADIRAEPRFLEEPGLLDLVYTIEEGVRCRVGRIDVAIKDQYNSITHTQWSTVLNRISLAPGDIVDIRELRASERRLRASGLFEVDPSKGISPKIVVVPPDPEEVEALLARQRANQVRGQTPEALPNAGPLPKLLWLVLPRNWLGEDLPQPGLRAERDPGQIAECFVVLRLEGELAKQPPETTSCGGSLQEEGSPSEESVEEVIPEEQEEKEFDFEGTPAGLEVSSGLGAGRAWASPGRSQQLAVPTAGVLPTARPLYPSEVGPSDLEKNFDLIQSTTSLSTWAELSASFPESNPDLPPRFVLSANSLPSNLAGTSFGWQGVGCPFETGFGIKHPRQSQLQVPRRQEENIVRGQYTPEGGITLSPLRTWRSPSVSTTISAGNSTNVADLPGQDVNSWPHPHNNPPGGTRGSGPTSAGTTPNSGNFVPPQPASSLPPHGEGVPKGQSSSSPVSVPLVPVEGSSPSVGGQPRSTSPVFSGISEGTNPLPQVSASNGQTISGVLPAAGNPNISGSTTSVPSPAGTPAPMGTLPGPPGPGTVPVPTPPPNIAPDVLPPLLGQPPDTEPTVPVPLQPEVYEGRTGRIMLSAGINSDAGLIGSLIVDEQNFDWRRWPRSWEDIRSGVAWRGAGQRFRLELVPGTEVQRYMASFQEPYLFDTDVSFGLSGYFYNRKYAEWDEDRLGGRVAFGYQFTHDLSGTFAIRAAEIRIYDPGAAFGLVPELDEVLGSNTLVGFGVTLTHDTRDSAFLPTEGHLYEISFEQVVGSFDYPRTELELRRYFLLRQHPDGSGRHVMSVSTRLAYTGSNTPIYEHYFAGGYSTLRGFAFRGASPRDPVTGLRIGGHFMLLASVEYMFPLTADDMLRLVVFCDTGTVQPDIDEWTQNYRVAPGFGFRVTLPALGPAPIALDFAFPVSKEPGDKEQVFSFFLGFFR